MHQLISPEEIQERLKKLKENDPVFPDVTLPEWLPIPIREVVDNFCIMTQGSQKSPDRVLGYDSYRAGIIYISKALPAFTNESTKDAWNKLCTLSTEEIENSSIHHLYPIEKAKKAAMSILHMENHIEFIFGQYEHIKWCIESEKNILQKTRELIQTKKNHMLAKIYGRLSIDSDPFLNKLIESESAQVAIIKGLEENLGSITDFQCEFMPVTRQSKNTGRATLYACFLHATFKRLYGKPMHNTVATLVNVFHKGTPYTQENIASMVMRSKKLANEKPPSLHQNVFEVFISGIIFKCPTRSMWITPAFWNEFSTYKKS